MADGVWYSIALAAGVGGVVGVEVCCSMGVSGVAGLRGSPYQPSPLAGGGGHQALVAHRRQQRVDGVGRRGRVPAHLRGSCHGSIESHGAAKRCVGLSGYLHVGWCAKVWHSMAWHGMLLKHLHAVHAG